ncbi:hypothetical protein [Paenibacillus rigui]|nr:hypothetical protein [Paenibacillus rigui]
MMDREQKTDREITFKVGWKRGKIKLNQNKLPVQEPSVEQEKSLSQPVIMLFKQWNERWIWRRAGHGSDRLLKPVLFVFPAAAFLLSLWLIYQLSSQP